MNRYMHCDFCPEFHVNFIKKGSVNDVPPVTLKDMGLSDDVDYRDQPLEELPKARKEAIIAEFMFLIDRLLPRNIQDLFYRIALDPRPAYWKAFEQAVYKMQLARYTDHNKNNYGQFIDHVQTGIMDMIADGMSIQDIYDSTCVTKSMLTETADALYMGNYSSQDHDRWQIIPIELVLFGMKDVTYSFNEEMTEFQIKRGNNDSLAIILVSYEDYFDIDCVIDIFDDEDYEKWDASCKMEEYIDNIDATVAEYEDKGIPALIIDPVYYGEWEEQKELRGMLRDAIGSIERTRQFNEDIKKKFTELTENEEEDIEEEQFIREMPFVLFEGQIKGMKLISNRLCFGPQPKPKDEIEQHLSLYSDGRVFFSGYVFGNNYEVKYQRSRGKQFKIPALVMTYLLSHVAMYFSKDFPLDLVMDVGDWTLELINTDGKSFKYTGALFSDLELDNVGLSSLIRKYLGMSDLLVFDGDARLPIIKDDDEYIFVNVFFEGGGKTYCYLCDDDLIQDGDEVLVPVGRDGELKSVIVDSVELHTAEDAPFPIDKCKKVVRRV